MRFHDLHPVLTGYRTDLLGEAKISAWELASDCSSSRAATILNLQVLGFMLPWHRAELLRAFVRGRRSRNLYRQRFDAELLERRVGEVRRELGVEGHPDEAAPAERAAFRRWAARATALVWGPLLPIALLLVWWLGG